MEDLVALLHRELASQSSIWRRRGGPAAASFPSAREQGGVGVGRRDVERREGGRRRPGCSAEPRTRGQREREERNTMESERDGESETETEASGNV